MQSGRGQGESPIKELNCAPVILWDIQIQELPLPKYGIVVDMKLKELNNQIIHRNVAAVLCCVESFLHM